MIDECLVVEVRVTGDDCPLAAASRAVDVEIQSDPPQRRADGNALLRFSAPRSDALAATLDADDRIRYLHRATTDGRDSYRCLSKHPCVVHALTDAGFLAETLSYRDGTERYSGAVVGYDVLRGVFEAAGETVGVRLERVYPLTSDEATDTPGRWDLTPAQEVALRTALEMGYFAVPREVTAADVATELDISKTAFLERLRRGLGGLLTQVFA